MKERFGNDSAFIFFPRCDAKLAPRNIVSDSSQCLISAQHVSRSYDDGQVQALRDVSVEIVRGEYVAVTGPSGSGKSTLLNVIGGLDRPDQGQVYFAGQLMEQPQQLDQLRRSEIGYVFQSFYLLPTLTAWENVQLPMLESSLAARDRQQKAKQLLMSVGMGHRLNHLPTKLSVGERQRVAIARSMANDPQVILADEPTGNLDSKTGQEILDLFDSLHAAGKTLVVITHSHEVAARAQRMIEVRDGQIVSDPTPLQA